MRVIANDGIDNLKRFVVLDTTALLHPLKRRTKAELGGNRESCLIYTYYSL